MKAIELMGIVDQKGHLLLGEEAISIPPGPVRVILLSPAKENDLSEEEWLHAASHNKAFEELHNPEEDIYSVTDGRPFDGSL